MTLKVDISSIRLNAWRQPTRTLVKPVSFELAQGGTLGVVGESGSGKSLISLAMLGLLPSRIKAEGRVLLDGENLLEMTERELQRVRGAKIGMIFQEPMSALNPSMRIGDQIIEGILRHQTMSYTAARERALQLLERVGIPDARNRLDAFPHEMSGGQRQRVGIAIAIAPGPKVLIADEPTTALDVTVQAEVLKLLGELVAEMGMSLLMISHDLGVIASICERCLVLNRGEFVEEGLTPAVLLEPAQEYTKRLIAAQPRLEETLNTPAQPTTKKNGSPYQALLEVAALEREYTDRHGRVVMKAVDGISFRQEAGTIHGIVGESGCGKSTLARIVMGLDKPTSGDVMFEGEDIFSVRPRELLRLRRQFQMIFQDPQGSLDPRQTISQIVAEPLYLDPDAPRGRDRARLVSETLQSVGLRSEDAQRYPHEFSGGQRQRIAIARAVIGRPKLIVADEPVSALDLSVQAQVLRLIMDLRDRLGVSFLFISHSLAVIETISDQVGVMYRGKFVETGAAKDVFHRPQHEYTRKLLAAEPRIDQGLRYGIRPKLLSA